MRCFFLFFLFLLAVPVSVQSETVQWGEVPLPKPRFLHSVQWGQTVIEQPAEAVAEENPQDQEFEVAAVEEIPLPQWLENGAAVPDIPDSQPMIAIVIDDLGVNRKMTRRVINLPAPITASFMAYADDLQSQTDLAKQAGHELLVHAPMEPLNPRQAAGAGFLTVGMSEEFIRDRLGLMLDSFDGYVGINNHMGSKFTQDVDSMRIVAAELKKRGLLFLDSLTSKDSVGRRVAREIQLPYAVRNVFLDNTRKEAEITKQLELLENYARKHHIAVGIGHPHKPTVEALKKWIPKAKERGIIFVPISLVAAYTQDVDQNFEALNPYDG